MALSSERSTLAIGPTSSVPLPVKAGVKIYKGSLVVQNSSGFALMCSGASTEIPMGRAGATVDNLSGSNGDKSVPVETGTFAWSIDETNPVTKAGTVCYAKDDQTVSASAADGPPCGIAMQLGSSQAFVRMVAPEIASGDAADSDLATLALSGGSGLIGHGASTVSFKLGTLSTADLTIVANLASTAGAAMIGMTNGGYDNVQEILDGHEANLTAMQTSQGAGYIGSLQEGTIQADLDAIYSSIDTALEKIITRRLQLTTSDINSQTGSSHTFNVGAVLPGSCVLSGYSVKVTQAVSDGGAGVFSGKIGADADDDAISSGAALGTIAEVAGTPGIHGFIGHDASGEQVTFTVSGDVVLSTVSAGAIDVKILATKF